MSSEAGRGHAAQDVGPGDQGGGAAGGRPGSAAHPGGAGAAGSGGPAGHPGRPRRSHHGGVPAQERELGAQGRQTMRRLLDAGMAEFDAKGLQAVRVDDIVRRAKTSHGTFYLYFKNKEDLFRALMGDMLHDMGAVTDEFPVVTQNQAGQTALRQWVSRFFDSYAKHAAVLRVLTQAEVISDATWSDGLQLMFRLAEAMTTGMTAAPRDTDRAQHAELTAVACLMMLAQVNFLLSLDIKLPREEMIDRIAAIIYAAFRS